MATTEPTYDPTDADSFCVWINTMLATKGPMSPSELASHAVSFDNEIDADQMSDFCFMMCEDGEIMHDSDEGRFLVTPGHCDRCNAKTASTTGSWFSTEMICQVCEASEKAHPDYDYAKQVETDAVAKGDYNFPGVGWPGIDGRVARS